MPLHLETIRLRLKTVVVIGISVRNRLHNLLLQLIVAVYHRRLRRFLVLMADVVRGQPGHVFVQLTELPLPVVRVQLRLQRQALGEIEVFLQRLMPVVMMAKALFGGRVRTSDIGRTEIRMLGFRRRPDDVRVKLSSVCRAKVRVAAAAVARPY